MAAIPVNQTQANLQRAFVCEALASRHYLACASRSDEEGHAHTTVVFRHVARCTTRYAEEHLKILDDLEDALGDRCISNTRDNLRAAVTNEQCHCGWYAGMTRTARDEGFNEIADWFEMLAKVSRLHAVRFQRALERLNRVSGK